MNRLFQTAAVALVLITPALAHAETSVSAPYRAEMLATPAGVRAIKADFVKAADDYCRSHPVEHTISECRQAMAAEMSRDLDVRAVRYAQANHRIQMARR